ncbi:hypothetical protein E2H86_09685 [Pseudomonas putida]|nr:hypothetical protein E2H86_09685 [Pseudomonas putida]
MHGGVPCYGWDDGSGTGKSPGNRFWHLRLFAGKVWPSISLYGTVSFVFDYRTEPLLANCLAAKRGQP